MNNDGDLRGNKVVKYDPAHSVVKLELGDRITLDAAQCDDLAAAVLADLQTKFR
jgi:hypothetical protein